MRIEIVLTFLLLVASFGFAETKYFDCGHQKFIETNSTLVTGCFINTSDFQIELNETWNVTLYKAPIGMALVGETKTCWKEDCNTCCRVGNEVATCTLLACNITIKSRPNSSEIFEISNGNYTYLINATSGIQTTEPAPAFPSCKSVSDDYEGSCIDSLGIGVYHPLKAWVDCSNIITGKDIVCGLNCEGKCECLAFAPNQDGTWGPRMGSEPDAKWYWNNRGWFIVFSFIGGFLVLTTIAAILEETLTYIASQFEVKIQVRPKFKLKFKMPKIEVKKR